MSKIADGALSSRVHAGQASAMDACLIQIESSFVRGFAGMQLLGNASDVARDGKERARVALESLGINTPARRIVVSATPADVKKDGNQFDLPVAVSLALLITGKEPRIRPGQWLFAAELGLLGELRPVRGVVSYVLAAMASGLDGVVVAPENLAEVDVLFGVGLPLVAPPPSVLAFKNLSDLLRWLFDGAESAAMRPEQWQRRSKSARRATGAGLDAADDSDRESQVTRLADIPGLPDFPDFDDMILDPAIECAVLVAAAGLHSMLLRGPPGTGKSMLSARFPSLLPPLSAAEHIEAMRIHGFASERLPSQLLAGRPPFRAPHHQASAAAILGTPEAPGEMSLAHGGVLFLDEFPEFRRDLLEALREPLETGEVRVARSKRKVTWKSRVILVAACNNCPCGWFGSRRRECTCATARLLSYRHRLSGPILERIDLHVNMPEPERAAADLFSRLAVPSRERRTATLAGKVDAARAAALARNAAFDAVFNRDLKARDLVAASGLGPVPFERLINRWVPRTASSRSALRTVRVARTLADLDASAAIRDEDVARAWAWQADQAARARGEEIPLLS